MLCHNFVFKQPSPTPCPEPPDDHSASPRSRPPHRPPARGTADSDHVRSGFSYEAIARDECLSRERIRQIVAKSLDVDDRATRVDYVRRRMARLEPALRLA